MLLCGPSKDQANIFLRAVGDAPLSGDSNQNTCQRTPLQLDGVKYEKQTSAEQRQASLCSPTSSRECVGWECDKNVGLSFNAVEFIKR